MLKKISAFCLFLFMLLATYSVFAEEWKCPNCGRVNTGNFCPDCGAKSTIWKCPACGNENYSAFCENCGMAKPVDYAALVGKWKFSAVGTTMYLTIENESDYVINSIDGGRIEGTYSVNGIYLTFSVDGQTRLSGVYSVNDDHLSFEHFGIGERTDEVSQFAIKMDGSSMNDTVWDGDVLTVICKDLSEIQRFDIVVVKYPGRGNTLFVKRLVGLPGDIVELCDGYLYINGEKYQEAYISDEYRTGILNSCGPYMIPEESYFVIGDHRNNSNDSRSIGALPSNMIIGVAVAINDIPLKDGVLDNEAAADIKMEGNEKDYPLQYQESINIYAKENDLDPALVAAIIRNESFFKAQTESSVGARGLMQLMPDTAEWIAHKLGIKDFSFDSMFDPDTNIRFGCWYLGYLSKLFNKETVCIVAAFHAGQGEVSSWLADPSKSDDGKTISVEKLPEGPTKIYIKRILRDISVYQKYYKDEIPNDKSEAEKVIDLAKQMLSNIDPNSGKYKSIFVYSSALRLLVDKKADSEDIRKAMEWLTMAMGGIYDETRDEQNVLELTRKYLVGGKQSKETAEPTSTPRVYGGTVLYYNPIGGEYYHLDMNCKRIAEKYLPLQGHFTYDELNKEEYRRLKPCAVCGAPLRE